MFFISILLSRKINPGIPAKHTGSLLIKKLFELPGRSLDQEDTTEEVSVTAIG
jgi:hypothetical protein